LVYIALEESNFIWREHEVKRFDKLWNDGNDIFTLAKIFKRPQYEIIIMIMDRHIQGEIHKRDYGLFAPDTENRRRYKLL
jgi:hypothetical protein